MTLDKRTIFLFDVDGTLTAARKKIAPSVEDFMETVASKVSVGLVGGSDLDKISEQMGGMDVVKKYDFVFAENGLVGYKNGNQFVKENILKHVGEENLQKLINFCLKYMSDLVLPAKRGTFVEFRDGLINVCPVGRSCSQEERDEFAEYDKVHDVRKKFVEAIKEEFPELKMSYSIGGQISFDMFPTGWDKTYCLQFLEKEYFDAIHFFGDKTDKGGNDHEIFTDSRTVGHRVTCPDDTVAQLNRLLFS